MDQNQPTASPAPVYSVPPRSMLSTGTPTIISFAVVILLFILPFSELRCGSTALASKSGIGFAIGSDWKPAGGLGKDSMGEMTTKTTGKKEGHAQYFAIGALALAL